MSKIEANRIIHNNTEIDRFSMSSRAGHFPDIQLKDENINNLSLNIGKINSFLLQLETSGSLEGISTSIEDVRKAITDINNFSANNQYPGLSSQLNELKPQLTNLAATLQIMKPLIKAPHTKNKF